MYRPEINKQKRRRHSASPTGWAFVALYAIATLALVYQGLTCGDGLCGLIAIIPLTPWVQLTEGLLGISLPMWFGIVYFAINAFLLYLMGTYLERGLLYLVRKIK